VCFKTSLTAWAQLWPHWEIFTKLPKPFSQLETPSWHPTASAPQLLHTFNASFYSRAHIHLQKSALMRCTVYKPFIGFWQPRKAGLNRTCEEHWLYFARTLLMYILYSCFYSTHIFVCRFCVSCDGCWLGIFCRPDAQLYQNHSHHLCLMAILQMNLSLLPPVVPEMCLCR